MIRLGKCRHHGVANTRSPPPRRQTPSGSPSPKHKMPTESEPRVGIIGAGLSGICVAIMLRDKLGLEERQIVGVERWGEVGGTWFVGILWNCFIRIY